MTTIKTRANVEYEILALLEAVEDADFRSHVNVWFELGAQDVFSRLRAWWAVRAARFVVEEDGVIYLPPSYLGMKTVVPWTGGRPLDPIAPDQIGDWLMRAGPPQAYLMEGLVLTLLPLQNADFEARCSYYSMLEPLDQDDSTNLYIERAASAFMYAGASHGALYREQGDRASMYAQSAMARIDAINSETAEAQYGTGITVRRRR